MSLFGRQNQSNNSRSNSLPLVFDIRPQSPQCQVIMKPSTPRKSRRRNQPGSAQPGPSSSTTHNIPVSDYESDAAVQIIQPTFQDPAQSTRGLPTLGDMNLRVLKRHLPTVQSYISMAHNTTVYEWDDKADSWGEPVFKGPLFVCDLYPEVDTDSGNRVTRACIFVINRMSLENLVLNLANVISCRQNDAEGQLLELSAVRPNGESVNWGLFIDQESVKETWAAIQGRWDVVRKTA